MNNKFSFLSIIIICILIVAIVSSIYLFKSSNNLENIYSESEEDSLKENNKEAIEAGSQFKNFLVKETDKSDHIWGDINAQVQIIIYDDFECPFCARFYDITAQIKQKFGDKVAIVFRHYPLSMHANAMLAALSSECASEQGKFWEMYDNLFNDNKLNKLSLEQFNKDAEELDLDTVEFAKCMDSKKYNNKIQLQKVEGKQAGASGTPTVFVNGELLPGAYPFEDFIARDGSQQDGMKSIIERHLLES